MLDDVRDERGLPVDAGELQGIREDPAGGADERMRIDGLLVARLLAHQHQRRRDRALAEHRLGRALPELAATAGSGLLAGLDERALGSVRAHLALCICKVVRGHVDIADNAPP